MVTTTEKIEIHHIFKSFLSKTNRISALEDINLEIKEGEFVCIVGPSGCGKSTLLNLVAGLAFPDQGVILVDGAPVTEPGQGRLMMFQESALFPWLDVWENVQFGLKLVPELDRFQREKIVKKFLKLVGLEKFSEANIHELSGGMKQRVALARALAPNPKVLLMDEPFASLDAMTREQLYIDLQTIQRYEEKTILLVTHNVPEAVCLGDRVILMSSNPGQVREEIFLNIPRPREIRSIEVAEKAISLTLALKHHAENHL